MRRPVAGEYAEYFQKYIDLVEGEDLLEQLSSSFAETRDFLREIPEDKWDYKYSEDKWTVKEVVLHTMDSERIFAYRALSFARRDETELPGYDHEAYIEVAKADTRSLPDIISEFETVRKATMSLFRSFDDAMLDRTGIANENNMSVLSLGFVLVGHERHHMNIIRERYLDQP